MSTDRNAFGGSSGRNSNDQNPEPVPVTFYAKPGQVARISVEILIGEAEDIMGGGDRSDSRSRPSRQEFRLIPVEPPRSGEGPDSATPDSATPDSATPDSATPDSATPDSATPDSAFPDDA